VRLWIPALLALLVSGALLVAGFGWAWPLLVAGVVTLVLAGAGATDPDP
jgi:hypothetical protein